MRLLDDLHLPSEWEHTTRAAFLDFWPCSFLPEENFTGNLMVQFPQVGLDSSSDPLMVPVKIFDACGHSLDDNASLRISSALFMDFPWQSGDYGLLLSATQVCRQPCRIFQLDQPSSCLSRFFSVRDPGVMIDLFGGFGGWKMGLSMLHHYAKAGLPPLLCSVEIDSDVALCSATAFQMPIFSEGTFCSTAMSVFPVHPVMIVGDVGSHKLAMGLSRFNIEVILASPSCQPWSGASSRPKGLACPLGGNFAHLLQMAMFCRPRILGIENVPGLSRHRHWPWLASAFRAIGYSFVHQVTEDIAQLIPLSRARFLIILCRTDLLPDQNLTKVLEALQIPRLPRPPVVDGSLLPRDVLLRDTTLKLTVEEQQRLMAIDFIPRWNRHRVQTADQLFQLRCIQEGSPLTCFLASYRRCLHFRDSTLRNGVFMQAHAIDNQFWALHAVEIASIMCLPDDILLPACHETAYKLLGNIFIPAHAAMTLLRITAILSAWDSTDDVIFDCLHNLVQQVMQHSWQPNFSTVSVDGTSWWKSFATPETCDEISPTLDFHGFTCVADLVKADFQVLVPIDASGDSISQELWERHLCQLCLVPEPSAASDLAGKLHIWTSADGIAFAPVAYQDSICLEGINAWLRSQSLPEWSWSFRVGCLAFDVDFRGNWTSGFWPPFWREDHSLVFHTTCDALEGTQAAIFRHDCWQIVRAAGFGIDIQIRSGSGVCPPVVLRIVQGSVQPRIDISDLQRMLFIGFFRHFLDELQRCPMAGCHAPVTITFGGTPLWKGTLANQLLIQQLHDAWSSAHIRVPFVPTVRCVIGGKQASHEFALNAFASPRGEIKIHLCVPLQGGGAQPLCSILWGSCCISESVGSAGN